MTNELLALFEYYEKEKDLSRATMVEVIESALLSASKKSIGPARELRISVDPDKGKIRAIATLVVVDNVKAPYDEVSLPVARRIKADAKLGDEIDVEITPKDFGRIAAQAAKQALMQRLRQEEKAKIYDEFKDRAGDIVSGTIRRFERSDVIVDLGKFEATMPSRERVKTEDYNIGDRIRAYVLAVDNGPRGPEIILSRSHPSFVRRLFEFEVTEIADRTVEIRGIAREAGYRTKIAVHSADDKIDPVGACVGLRGARVKNIVRELNNEKVDIIRWSDDPRQFIKDALKPAELRTIEVDPVKRSIRVTVDEEELSRAIGRHGQNARLTSKLMDWDVKIERDETAHEQFEARKSDAAGSIAEQLGIDPSLAVALVSAGMNTIETIAGLGPEDIVNELREREVEIDEATAARIIAKAVETFGGDA
ncbi:MAG: transcription termination/antitermination protein NusA [Verrucomicrobia bacterium]|nr:transcription termination/antitermination protein NusA [Verrucomicrobiota bacterium]